MFGDGVDEGDAEVVLLEGGGRAEGEGTDGVEMRRM